MDPVRWKRVKSVFEEALELPEEHRTAFLDHACDDGETRREVESLLASHASSGGFLEGTGARELVAAIVAETPDDERVGQRFGPYRIVRRLGGGGMGAVFLAARDDGEFQRRVAVKIVRHGMLLPEAVRHFRHERQTLADLEHPNIARLLDGGTTEEGVPFFLMEYVDGEPLTTYCDEGRLGIDGRLRLLVDVARAVEFAHRRGVIHRDLKPGNLLVTDQGVPKLLDFGVAKLLQTEGADADTTRTTLFPEAMTPRYASPEQLRGGRVTAASDVYSLGVLLYELLTGRRPYSLDGLSPGAMEERVCEVEPLAPSRRILEPASRLEDGGPGDIDERARARSIGPRELQARLRGDLDRVVMKALRKRSDGRYRSAEELADDLERVLAGKPVRARAGEMAYRARSWGRRARPYAAAAVVALVALLAGYWVATRGSGSALQPMSDFQHRSLVTSPASEADARISPDGSRVAYLSDRGGETRLWLHELTGDTRQSRPASSALPPTARGLAWAPGGGRLAFLWKDGETRRLGTVTPDGEGFDRLGTAGEVPEEPSLLRWLDDGLYFLRNGQLWHFDPASGRRRRLTPEDFPRLLDADVSRDGRWLAFIAAPGSSPDLWLSATDGSELRPLLQGPATEASPSFRGPDDQTVIYTSTASDQVDIWEIDPDSLERVARTTSVEAEEYLDASADGRSIVFHRTEADADLHLLDPADGTDELLTADARDDFLPMPLHDGRILFQRGKPEAEMGAEYLDAEIHVTDLAELSEAGPGTRVAEGFAAVPSPDGRWIAVTRHDGRGRNFRLAVLELETGRTTIVSERHNPGSYRPFPLSFQANVAWAPDGRSLYFVAWTDAAGAAMERVEVDALDAGSSVVRASEGNLGDIRLSPGGTRMAWTETAAPRGREAVLTSTASGAGVERRAIDYDGIVMCGWLDDDTLVVVGRMHDGGPRSAALLLLDGRLETLVGPLVLEAVPLGGVALDRRRRTVYFTGESGGIHNMYAWTADDGGLRRITNNRIGTRTLAGTAVLPDGRLLFSEQSRNPDLWMLTLGR